VNCIAPSVIATGRIMATIIRGSIQTNLIGSSSSALEARLPPPPLLYPLSNEALLPERAGCRDRFGAG